MRKTLLHPASLVVLALFAASFLLAERVSEDVPISNWAAPPYWVMPSAHHRAAEQKGVEAVAIANPSLAFHAVTPCRIADTRGFGFTGPYGPPSLTANTVRSFAVTSPGTSCGIPSGVAAVSFNFAATSLTANGNLIVYPQGAAQPSVSSLNWTPSEVAISNAAVIPLGSDSISVVVNGPNGSTADLIIDVNGYYAADPVVSSLNGSSGAVTLVGGSDVTVTPGSGTVTIGVDSTQANTPNTVVRRGSTGEFAAGAITATDLDLGGGGRILQGGSLYLHSSGDTTNTFLGFVSGNSSVTGSRNTGVGNSALSAIAGGSDNVALGFDALNSTTAGQSNVAVGVHSLSGLPSNNNTAVGHLACASCTGSANTAIGYTALAANMGGNNNIAIGAGAGFGVSTGSNGIYIGSSGSTESNTIRIGSTQTATYVAGISGATTASGVPVLVNSSGQLGTTTSSARFKEDVRDVGSESDGLYRLRPVAFRYKAELDSEGIEQFGLIAEEVEKVYPGLVTCGEDGQPQAVRYHFLVPMLLNEAQKDRRELDRSRAKIADLESRLERLEKLLSDQ